MSDARPDDPDPPAPMALGETLDLAMRRLTTGIVVAGAIVGLAVYARPAPPRFDAFAVGEKIVRVDMKTGTIIACEGAQTCQLILKHGQKLARIHRTNALPPAAAPKPLPAAPAAEK